MHSMNRRFACFTPWLICSGFMLSVSASHAATQYAFCSSSFTVSMTAPWQSVISPIFMVQSQQTDAQLKVAMQRSFQQAVANVKNISTVRANCVLSHDRVALTAQHQQLQRMLTAHGQVELWAWTYLPESSKN